MSRIPEKVICDICGIDITEKGRMLLKEQKCLFGLGFKTYGNHNFDLCHSCWYEIKDCIKNKNEKNNI